MELLIQRCCLSLRCLSHSCLAFVVYCVAFYRSLSTFRLRSTSDIPVVEQTPEPVFLLSFRGSGWGKFMRLLRKIGILASILMPPA